MIIMDDRKSNPALFVLPSGESIAYHSTAAADHNINTDTQTLAAGVLYCNGFRSSMNGNKALALEQFCRRRDQQQHQLGFTQFDYRGHGPGNNTDDYFESLGLSDWIDDARAILDHCVTQQGGPQIIVGSSMGVWIACHLALSQPRKVAGILGIASAVDFTEDICQGLTPAQELELNDHGRLLLPSEYSTKGYYPISRHLLQDAAQWLLLSSRNSQQGQQPTIGIQCPVRLVHGQQDAHVPWQKSMQLAEAIASKDVHLTLIKQGDHRLSTPRDLHLITRILEELFHTVRTAR
jgi:pimeloyl-ACP methyl ester carboxylesterase